MTTAADNLSVVRQALTYRGEALRAIALPLGGIGTGSIALAGDGGLRQWQIVNNVNHDAHVPNSFFAIWAGDYLDARRNAVVLQSKALYDDSHFTPAPSISDHLIPEGSRRLLNELPGVESLEITAQYPIIEVAYQSGAIPVHVHLETFSPFIPLNSKDSGLPAIIFNFTVTNPQDHPINVSLMGAQQNIVGWDGKTHIDNNQNFGYGGNVNHLIHLQGITAIDMNNVRLGTDHPANGSLALAVLEQSLPYSNRLVHSEPDGRPQETEAERITAMPQWEAAKQLWDYFGNLRGVLPNQGSVGASDDGQTWNGALSAHFRLEAGASHTVTFVLAWYFPNRYVTWDQRSMGVLDRKSHFWLGNQYNRHFKSALNVVEYIRDNYERLVEQTRLFRDSFFDSTLPWEVLESAAAPISTLRSPTCIWNEDGRFHGFEGCHGASTIHGALEGCCPMNCTHVWNYEMALAKLFPDLEQLMRYTDLVDQISPWGSIPHRTPLPLYLPRPFTMFIGGPRNPAMDGEMGTVLKTYREVLHGANKEWFDMMWTQTKKLMQHIMTDYDTEGDGVIRGEQPNTYDISIFGPNTFIGSMYLAALRAAEEMAKLQGEDELAQQYRARFELGSRNYDTLCWNGEYYIQVVDLNQHTQQQFGTGCHIDQLLGQWWAHVLGLGYVLPEAHVKTAIRNIVKFNYREGFDRAAQKPRVYMDERDRGLYICTWPHGDKPEIPTQYSDEVWSGLEYPLAGMLLYADELNLALDVLANIRHRHNGTRRSPWNEVECGDHYVRAMASWTTLEAASGYRYDAIHGILSFAPRFTAENFQSFFITGSAWGRYSEDHHTARISVHYGELTLNELRIKNYDARDVYLGDERIDADISQVDGYLSARFAQPVIVRAGERLALA